ncbi:LysE family translocator [Sporomusa acidovorans]|uniref:Homoserine/homoserine lactone efflux protein n=1 Tax=Sporomusa acidovorans (strain ATCC 49682 / DSM 3132 / Mol) TaxID=1123286 RepID=A0ABZ3J9U9_SPOA4|nr:LysE family translocator [Sporomusa acidovorans]OZC16164.1 homoserine/homoserine lactone efflux protein [Sporomusa acidovorans DSM 3132]SDE29647.1 Threonine/homoserine/homoserine lactone efflux protein [Sporomusa acidovorans]
MDDITYWLLFLSASLAINISPGPDLLYILSRTIASGKNVGMACSLGVGTGALVHVTAAALGLSAILATSVLAFSLVKYVGAAYLIYLGIKNFRSHGNTLELPAANLLTVSSWAAFKQEMLVDILNPKAAIFFMAFLPQFIRPEIGTVPLQLLGLGILVILMGFAVEFSFIFLAAKITGCLRRHQAMSSWLDRAFGSILIALGVRLAFVERT